MPDLSALRKNFDLVLVIVGALLAYMLLRRFTRFNGIRTSL